MFNREDGAPTFAAHGEMGRSAAHHANAVKNGREDTEALMDWPGVPRLDTTSPSSRLFWILTGAARSGRVPRTARRENPSSKVADSRQGGGMRDSVYSNPAALRSAFAPPRAGGCKEVDTERFSVHWPD